MASVKELTGGTRDVNPQWLTVAHFFQDDPNKTATDVTPVPINRYPQGKQGRVNIMEVLKVYWEATAELGQPSPGADFLRSGLSAILTTRRPAVFGGVEYPQMQDPAMIDILVREYYVTKPNGATQYDTGAKIMMEQDPVVHDLTDGAGHGLLVASDFLFVQLGSYGMVGRCEVKCKILYRYKQVSLTEYIGIVQSQQ